MKKKLEIGCGQRPTEGYLHQDVCPQEGVTLDFSCNPWEIDLPENCLEVVVACGVMEHLRFADFKATLAHIYRLLQPGGCFLFDVPDMVVWSEYLYNLTHGKPELNPFTAEHVWSTLYGWQRWPGDEHKSGWTRETLWEAIREAGFEEIQEGVQHYLELGFDRGRFHRPHDAHLYPKAVKKGRVE